jgi:AcrR family transcriptional regulator
MSDSAAQTEGRRDRKRRELRERVYERARELFSIHGFDATTVEQIAEAADIAPATFFNHFQSKHTLLEMMTGEIVTFLEALLAEHLRRERDLGAELIDLGQAAGKLIAENHRLARDVVLETVRAEKRPEQTAPYLVRVHEPVARAILHGQRVGEVRDDQDPVFLAEMVIGMLNAALTQWLSDPEYPIVDQLPRAAAFAWEAVRAEGRPS